MKKLLTTIIMGVCALACANAQIRLRAPHAPTTNEVSAQSSTVTWDTSLLKAVVFFDGLDHSYGAVNYNVGQIDGLFKNPIMIGVAGAWLGNEEVWGGPSVSYEFFNNGRFSLSATGAFPGLTYANSQFSFSNEMKMVPGVMFSFKL